jgi:hypothetical protein
MGNETDAKTEQRQPTASQNRTKRLSDQQMSDDANNGQERDMFVPIAVSFHRTIVL